MKYRTRPFEIEAVQFTGDNWDELREFAPGKIDGPFEDWEKETLDDPDADAAVFDDLHSTWVLFYKDNYIIRGMKGEYYPCVAEVFETKYEAV